MRIVIIGAGLSGLNTAVVLQKAFASVIVLEKNDAVGGRIRSIYDSAQQLAYESGPWRIPETHRAVVDMCKSYGVRLTRRKQPPPMEAQDDSTTRGLSIWETRALSSHDPLAADAHDLNTGYADETDAASGTAPYIAHADAYFVAPDGFSRLTDRLGKSVRDLRLNVMVEDITKANNNVYRIQYVRREKNTFKRDSLLADVVVVCVPPHACKAWSIMRAHALPVMCAVRAGSLNHIYARNRELSKAHFHLKSARSLLAQTISGSYGNEWFQASYSGGRVAQFWYNLYMSNPVRFLKILATNIWSTLAHVPHATFGHEDVKMHFWEHAYHMWIPTPYFDLQKALDAAREPHPVKLPNIYVAGEAFSEHQAWMEGALTTSNRVIRAILSKKQAPVPPRIVSKAPGLIVLDGRVLDVSQWSRVHPGGEEAIRNHEKDADVHELFKFIHASDRAHAIVLSLQIGYCAS